MKKALRIAWLVVAFIALLPLIIVFEVIWVGVCMYSARLLNEPISLGVRAWCYHLKQGLVMNADFVRNGL